MYIELFATVRDSGLDIFTDKIKGTECVIIQDCRNDSSIAFAAHEINKLCEILQSAKLELEKESTS